MEEIMECLYVQWDLATEDRDVKRANKLDKISESLREQYNEQLKSK